MHKILVIIPARGGSKGIPKKNLRSLNGRPLIAYSIEVALKSEYRPDVYVSTEDAEIMAISKKIGAKVVIRDASKAQDDTTLDPVIFSALEEIAKIEDKKYDIVITLQPTSPLLRPSSLDAAIERLLVNSKIDTIISTKEDAHLSWKVKEGTYFPNYLNRVNRQYLEPIFRETGGFLITRSVNITALSRIGKNVDLFLLSGGEEIDIDSYEDWSLCEFYLKQRKILFVVAGWQDIGLGHIYNALVISNCILNHHIEFLVDKKSQMAFDLISSKNYSVKMQTDRLIESDIIKIAPDIVINDRLDTSEEYIYALKSAGIKVVNFEDLGPGAKFADLVINAIYPEKEILPRHYFGHDYFVLRDEFLLTSPRTIQKKVKNVLVTFGGVDPNNFTFTVINAIYDYCKKNGIKISVVAGFGYGKYETLKDFDQIEIFSNISSISDQMKMSDIAFTAAGRTTYELASLNIPTIVLAQNEREMTHFFASAEYGFMHLGMGPSINKEEILQAFSELVENYSSRKYMASLMAKINLADGRKRVLKLINDLLE